MRYGRETAEEIRARYEARREKELARERARDRLRNAEKKQLKAENPTASVEPPKKQRRIQIPRTGSAFIARIPLSRLMAGK